MNSEVEHWDPIFSGNISSSLRFWLSLETSVLIFLPFFHFLLPFRFFNSHPLLTFSPLRSAVRRLLRCAIYPPFCLSRFSSSLKPLKPDSPSQEQSNSTRRSSATTTSNAEEESQPEYSPLVKGFEAENTTSRIRKIDVFIWPKWAVYLRITLSQL